MFFFISFRLLTILLTIDFITSAEIRCLEISWWKENSCIFENVTLSRGVDFTVSISVERQHSTVLVNFLNGSIVPVLPESFFRVFPNLEILDIHNAEMIEIGEYAFQNARRLEHLSFSDNRIKKIPENAFLGAAQLERIGLERNRIHNIEEGAFFGLQNLKKLNLQDNQIVQLPEYIFRPLCKLEDLNLSKNRIEIVKAKDVSCNKKLKIVNLEGNWLKKIDPMILCIGENFEQLILQNNSCLSKNCDLIFLRLGQCFSDFLIDEKTQSKTEHYQCLKRMLDKHYTNSHDQLFTENKSIVMSMWRKFKKIF